MALTRDYPFCEFDFWEWNPVQEQCLPYFTDDKNLVLGSSTASGKTSVAEAIMGHVLHTGLKAIYVSPLKALGREKAVKWSSHPTFSEHGVVQVDGDHRHGEGEIDEAGVVVSTIEALDVACRRNDEWVGKAGVLVFDEAHLFDYDRRGASSEAMVMQFTRIAPKARLVFLSGTMPNVREMATWAKRLNGKPTAFIHSKWRPYRVEKEVKFADGFSGQVMAAVREIDREGKENALVFVHSKAAGEAVCRELKSRGVPCAMYHADLDAKTQEKIVRDFKSPCSRLSTVVATSSLALGVTL